MSETQNKEDLKKTDIEDNVKVILPKFKDIEKGGNK